MVFLVLNTGMVLYAKNTAVNSAHQQARAGVDQMLTNLHNSVSIPQLTDANLVPLTDVVDGSGQPTPAAGISFQTFDAGPFPVVVQAELTPPRLSFSAGATPRLLMPGSTSPRMALSRISSLR